MNRDQYLMKSGWRTTRCVPTLSLGPAGPPWPPGTIYGYIAPLDRQHRRPGDEDRSRFPVAEPKDSRVS